MTKPKSEERNNIQFREINIENTRKSRNIRTNRFIHTGRYNWNAFQTPITNSMLS